MLNSESRKLFEKVLYELGDSYRGYKSCAQEIKDETLKKRFLDLSDKRQLMLEALAQKAQDFGLVVPEDPKEGSYTGAAHRFFVKLKSFFTGSDTEKILDEIKTGESYLTDIYKEALGSELEESLKDLLKKHLSEIEEDLEAIKKES